MSNLNFFNFRLTTEFQELDVKVQDVLWSVITHLSSLAKPPSFTAIVTDQFEVFIAHTSLYKWHGGNQINSMNIPSALPFLCVAPLIFFDGHFDRKNGCATHFRIKVSVTAGTMLNFEGDFDGVGDVDTMCERTLSPNIHSPHVAQMVGWHPSSWCCHCLQWKIKDHKHSTFYWWRRNIKLYLKVNYR